MDTSVLENPVACNFVRNIGNYQCADKSLAQPTSQCILFDGENISFDASLVIYIYIYIVIISLQL
jgi:hypothetical protein